MEPDNTPDSPGPISVPGSLEIDGIEDLSAEEATELAYHYGIFNGSVRIRGIDDVILYVKIYLFKKHGGYQSVGREPFRILESIRAQHKEKCRGLADLFKDLHRKLSILPDDNKFLGCLTKTIPGFVFPESLNKHIENLSNEECCRVMITGELCSGKTSLINSLLGETILPCSLFSNTFTICEIRYGDKRSAVAHPWTTDNATVIIVEDEHNTCWDTDYDVIQTLVVSNRSEAEIVSKIKYLFVTEPEGQRFRSNVHTSATRAEVEMVELLGYNDVESHNEVYGDLGKSVNCALRRRRSAWDSGHQVKPMAVKILTSDAMFPETLAQFVQAKSKQYDELGVYKIIEVYLSNKLLQGGLTIVDSPGIGDNQSLTNMVIDYTAEAFAFIYVINSERDSEAKGGVQDDRLKLLLHKVQSRRRSLNNQSLFKPESAIFVCNKWDKIKKQSRKKVFDHIKKSLEGCWPGLKAYQIVPFSADEAVKVYEHKLLTPEFKDLLEKIEKLIEFGLENKVLISLSWLEGLLMNIDKVLQRFLWNIDTNDRKERFQLAKVRMDKLQKLSNKTFDELRCFVNGQMDEVVATLSAYLQSEQSLKELSCWTDLERQSLAENWDHQVHHICRQLDHKVKAAINRWEMKNQMISAVIPKIKVRISKWLVIEQIYKELEEIQRIVENNPRNNLLTTQLFVDTICHKAAPLAITDEHIMPPLTNIKLTAVASICNTGRHQENLLKLEAYKLLPDLVLEQITRCIVPQCFNANEFKAYVRSLMDDAYKLIDEWKDVIPAKLVQEEMIMAEIEKARYRDAQFAHTYLPFRESCRVFTLYIQHYALMNLTLNNRDVTVLPQADIRVTNADDEAAPTTVTSGWFSEIVRVKVKGSSEVGWLRRILPKVTSMDIKDYLDEETQWRNHLCEHLPKLVAITVNAQTETVQHILMGVGSYSLRGFLLMHIRYCQTDCLTRGRTITVSDHVLKLRPYAMQIVEGLKYLHSKQLVCGDLTLDTVTITQTEKVKLTNLAYVKSPHIALKNAVKDNFTIAGRKCRYLPREILAECVSRQCNYSLVAKGSKKLTEETKYGPECDVYSFGLLLWEMITGELAFQDEIDKMGVNTVQEFFDKLLKTNCRPIVPDYSLRPTPVVKWFNTIEKCWVEKTDKRPEIGAIAELLDTGDIHPEIAFEMDHFF